MPSKAEIICIPPVVIGAMWPVVGMALLEAHVEVTDCELEKGLRDIHESCASVLDGTAQLWALMEDDRAKAAWLTEIRKADGGTEVVTSTIPARVMAAYGDSIREAMTDFARGEGAAQIIINRTGGGLH